jgi:hypothetical protein
LPYLQPPLRTRFIIPVIKLPGCGLRIQFLAA